MGLYRIPYPLERGAARLLLPKCHGNSLSYSAGMRKGIRLAGGPMKFGNENWTNKIRSFHFKANKYPKPNIISSNKASKTFHPRLLSVPALSTAAIVAGFSKKLLCERIDDDTPSVIADQKNQLTSYEAEKEKSESSSLVVKSKSERKWGMLLSLMSEDLILYIAAALSSILSSLASSAQAKVFGSLFDLIGGDINALAAPIQQLVGLFAAQAGLSFFSSIALAIATNKLGNKLRKRFFDSVVNMDIEYFDENKTGEITHQLTQDISALQTSVRTCFTRGIEGLTALISGSVYLYLESPKLATSMLAILPVMSFAANSVGYLLRGISEKVRKATTKSTGVASESISSVRTIRTFGGEARELERYSAVLEEVTEQKKIMAVAAGAFYSSLGLGLNLIALLVCGYGGYLVQQGELTKGGVAAVATQVQMLERALARLSMLSAQTVKAFRASEHVFDVINLVPKVNTSVGGKGLILQHESTKGRVQFKNVYFKYPCREDCTVLNGFDLTIEPGQVVALVGPSGSGKSTTTALLERFYDTTSGEILIDGVNVKDIEPSSLHELVGTVSQEPILFATSILENIRYGRPDATIEEVKEAAHLANAHYFIESFPEGYETILGERGALLSGGQKQRVAIARAILSDPKILLLDEATSSLDNRSEKLVQSALNTLMKGRTTLIIAHRLTTVEGADVICVVSDGRIIEQGAHKSLLEQKDSHYRALFRRQNSRRV